MRVQFEIIGVEPAAAARPRVTRTGHAFMPKKTTDFENLVARQYEELCGVMLNAPVGVEILLEYPLPKSTPKNKVPQLLGTFRDKKPDIDNICKSIMDGLTKGGAYEDDSKVAALVIKKVYGEQYRITVTLEELGGSNGSI